MSEEEIKEYLKKVDELESKLTSEDKDTYQWLLFGYNECAKLLNEKEQENKQLKEMHETMTKYALENEVKIDKYKEVIEEVKEDIVFCINGMKNEFACTDSRTNRELHTMVKILEDRLQILDKAKENK